MKIFLITYFILHYGILFILNSFLVYKKTGKNPFVLGSKGGITGFVEKSIKQIGIIAPFVLVIYVFFENQYRYLVPVSYLETNTLDMVGILLMILSFFWCLGAQINMHTSWRIGIDKSNKPDLVSRGLFTISRNPFFLGTLFTNMGFFLILPNILTFTFMIVYYILIQTQVRQEEEFLKESLGANYLEYTKKVKRWLW